MRPTTDGGERTFASDATGTLTDALDLAAWGGCETTQGDRSNGRSTFI